MKVIALSWNKKKYLTKICFYMNSPSLFFDTQKFCCTSANTIDNCPNFQHGCFSTNPITKTLLFVVKLNKEVIPFLNCKINWSFAMHTPNFNLSQVIFLELLLLSIYPPLRLTERSHEKRKSFSKCNVNKKTCCLLRYCSASQQVST